MFLILLLRARAPCVSLQHRNLKRPTDKALAGADR